MIGEVKAILAIRELDASGLPASSPKPFTTLSTPGGSKSWISSIQHQDAQRHLGRFVEYHAIAGGQRRCQFPDGHQNRKIPGNDLPTTPSGSVKMIGHRIIVELTERPLLGAYTAGKVTEMIDRQGISARFVSRIGLPLS